MNQTSLNGRTGRPSPAPPPASASRPPRPGRPPGHERRDGGPLPRRAAGRRRPGRSKRSASQVLPFQVRRGATPPRSEALGAAHAGPLRPHRTSCSTNGGRRPPAGPDLGAQRARDWEWVMGVNVMGVAPRPCALFTPMMLAAEKADPSFEGHIVNTASHGRPRQHAQHGRPTTSASMPW